MIRYLPHADEAMQKRGLLREWVEATIAAPDWVEPDPRYPERTRSFKVLEPMGGRVRRVVHWADGLDIVVLTAMPDRNARKQRSLP